MTWNNFFFQNSNSPMMEQMIFFHNHSMIIILFITTLIIYMILNITFNKNMSILLLENQYIEIIWTILPTIMLIFIALPSLQLLYLMEENYLSYLTIKIMGHQWYWSYEYNNFNIFFNSFMIPQMEINNNSFRLLEVDNNLILPFNIFIKTLISSEDVIHAWTIPSLSIKMDAIPGRLNQMIMLLNRPGNYFGQCSEICGSNHSFMPISVESTSIFNFINWINSYI